MNLEINNSAEPGKPTGAVKPAEPTLEGWKEIATFLKRDVRTVMRWEKAERLPVRRHLHSQRSSVYALPSELKAWQAARVPQTTPQTVAWWRPRPALGLAAAIFLLMVSFRGGPLAELQAQAQTSQGRTVTEVYSDLGLDAMGSISPDGKRYAGTDWNRGVLAVWDLASGKSQTLTDDANGTLYVQWPRWSRDGGRIAYQFCVYGSGCRLDVIKASGGEPEISYQPAGGQVERVLDWSPDGKSVLCGIRGSDKKYVLGEVDVASRQFKSLRQLDDPIPAAMAAQFAPDGKTIAHVGGKLGKPRVSILSLETGVDIPVTSGGSAERTPIWTPDGKRLLFTGDRSGRLDLWSVDVVDGQPKGSPTMVYADIGGFGQFNGWRDDRSLLYGKSVTAGNFYTVAIDPASGRVGEAQSPVPYFTGQHWSGRWSPDGKSILIVVSGKGTYLYTPATDNLRHIDMTSIAAAKDIPGWFPSGDLALWSMSHNPNHSGTLYRVTSSGKIEQVYNDNRSYGPGYLSADGSIVAYARDVDAAGTSKPYSSIVLYDLKRHRVLKEMVAPPARYFSSPQLSADAKWLFYEDLPRSRGEVQRIMAIPVASGEPRAVVEIPPDTELWRHSVSPDGQYILYSAVAGSSTPGKPVKPRVFLIGTHGGSPQALNLPDYQDAYLYWSPDGKHISYNDF